MGLRFKAVLLQSTEHSLLFDLFVYTDRYYIIIIIIMFLKG